jgi:hypothetical protein
MMPVNCATANVPAGARAVFPMTESHENENTTPLAVGDSRAQLPVAANLHANRRKVWASFFVSVVFTLVLIRLKMSVEKTDFGKQFEEMSYGVLQHHLAAPTADTLRVIVLDISGIPMRPANALLPGLVTDRSQLSQIVSSLVTEDDKPLAIGLDVDFSPSSHGYADSADPGIFNDFLNLQSKSKVPIRVGVNSSLGLGPGKWLLNPNYLPLASCVVVPNPEKGQSTRYMLEALDVDYGTPLAPYYAGETGHCPSMGFALVQASVRDVPWWAKPFVESVVQKSGGPVSKDEFLVDYSALDLLSVSPPEISPNSDLSKFKSDHKLTLANKVVLIGRTKNTSDTFTVPGKPEMPYAGVFLHACAAYTLLERPLYHIKEPGRFLIDIVLSLAIFGVVLGIRLRTKHTDADEFFEHRLPELLAFFVALSLISCELWFVPRTHLMWDDFLLVAVVLLAHTPIEHAAGRGASLLAGYVRSWRDALAPSSHRRSEGK